MIGTRDTDIKVGAKAKFDADISVRRLLNARILYRGPHVSMLPTGHAR
jgi:hypothetical protein